MADATTENKPAESVNTVVNDVVQAAAQAAEKAIELEIETAAPVFALPVIRQLEEFTVEEIVGKVADKISIGLQTVGTFVVIDTQVSHEKTGVSEALANLMIAEKSGDPAQIQKAIKAYADAQSSLTHSDGSATPHT